MVIPISGRTNGMRDPCSKGCAGTACRNIRCSGPANRTRARMTTASAPQRPCGHRKQRHDLLRQRQRRAGLEVVVPWAATLECRDASGPQHGCLTECYSRISFQFSKRQIVGTLKRIEVIVSGASQESGGLIQSIDFGFLEVQSCEQRH